MSLVEVCPDFRDWDRVPEFTPKTAVQRDLLPLMSYMLHEDICDLADREDWSYDFYKLLARADWNHREFDDTCEFALEFLEAEIIKRESGRRAMTKEDIVRVMKTVSEKVASLCAASWTRTEKELIDELSDRAVQHIRRLVSEKTRIQDQIREFMDRMERSRYDRERSDMRRDDRREPVYRGRERDYSDRRGDDVGHGRWGGNPRRDDVGDDRRNDRRESSRSDSHAEYKTDRRGPRGQSSHYSRNLNNYVNDQEVKAPSVSYSRIEAARRSVSGATNSKDNARFSGYDPENFDRPYQQAEQSTQVNSAQYNQQDYNLEQVPAKGVTLQQSFRKQSKGNEAMQEINYDFDDSVNSFEDLEKQQQAEIKSRSIEERLAKAQAELDEESKDHPATKAGVRRMAYSFGNWIYKEPPILAPTKGTEMEQAKHGAIYNATEGMERKPLTDEIKRSLDLATLAFKSDAKPEEVQEHVDDDTFAVLVSSDSEAVKTTQADAIRSELKRATEKGLDERRIHRKRCVVNSAIIGRKEINGIHTAMAKAQSVSDFRKLLIKTLQMAETDCTAASPVASDMRAAAEFVNKQITADINEFLINVMELGTHDAPMFTSFMDDIEEVKDLIQENLGTRASNSFSAFLHNYACAINKAFNDPTFNLQESAREAQGFDESVGALSWPKIYLTTNVPFTLGELGYKDLSRSVTVERNITPFMDSLIIKDVNVLQSRYNNEYIGQVLITRCGAMLRVYPHPTEKKYILVRVKM